MFFTDIGVGLKRFFIFLSPKLRATTFEVNFITLQQSVSNFVIIRM